MLTLQVFENGALLVVVSFDAAVAEQEGDLTGYMNELARLNSVPGSWQLCKSTANWGQVQVHATHESFAFCIRAGLEYSRDCLHGPMQDTPSAMTW